MCETATTVSIVIYLIASALWVGATALHIRAIRSSIAAERALWNALAELRTETEPRE